MKIPTFRELLVEYPKIAAMERIKSERPCQITVANTLCGVRMVLELLKDDGADDECQVTWLTTRRIDKFLLRAAERGLSSMTAWTYALRLKGLTAHWTRLYYESLGWKVPSYVMPFSRKKTIRYIRPDRTVLKRVRDWYIDLWDRTDKRYWLVVTMMLEFGMRNGDVKRLRWSDFREKYGDIYLCYTPHKTALSSGRRVSWPVHPDIWTCIEFAKRQIQTLEIERGKSDGGIIIPGASYVFLRLNQDLRDKLIFSGNKGLYELRKICIDHVYQKFGAEMAVSISGDDIKTITRYYADPAQPNIGSVRILDLL